MHQEECDFCHGKKEIETQWNMRKCKQCSGTGKIKCPAFCRGGIVWTKDAD
jgi:DnaJ-class molecular chaperone